MSVAAYPRHFASLVKIEHTVFALPFAYVGAFLAVGGAPSAHDLLWITVAMVGARSLAMGLNRLIDASIDGRNPRTAGRELPTGRLTEPQVAMFCLVTLGLFLLAVRDVESGWQLHAVPGASCTAYPTPALSASRDLSTVHWPLASDTVGTPAQPLGAAREVCLKPGDLLSVPRGHVHDAYTSDSYSLHLTVGINVYRWADLIQHAVTCASRREPRFRRAIPGGALPGRDSGPGRGRARRRVRPRRRGARAAAANAPAGGRARRGADRHRLDR